MNRKKEYCGGYEICEALGYELEHHLKIRGLLNLIKAPKTEKPKWSPAYCLTQKQINYLKMTLKNLEKKLGQ